MTVSVTHATVAAGTDAGNGEIAKAQWNEAHTVEQDAAGLLGNASGAGTSAVLSASSVRTFLNVADGATANAGTVTSVGVSVPTGFDVGSTPVTSSGTIAITYTTGYQGYTSTEASKLSGIASGATANSSDATLLARANHTGTQAASTISDFSTAADARVSAAVGVTVQAYAANLTSWAAVTPSSYLTTAAAAAAYQPLDAQLTSLAALTDPNADRIVFWDDSAGQYANLTASTGLTISGTSMTVRTASESQTGIAEQATVAEAKAGTDTSRFVTPSGLAGANATRLVNTQTGSTYTFVLADAGKVVIGNSGSAQTFTVPPNSSVAYDIGTQIDIIQFGAGQITFAPGSGVTIGSKDSALNLTGQYSAATLIKQATDVWVLLGDLSA